MALKSYPAAEQPPLTIGGRLYDLAFLGRNGGAVSLYGDRLFGWPKVVLLAPSLEAAGAEPAKLAALFEEFSGLETQVLAVTTASPEENDKAAEALALPYPVLSDAGGALAGALGLSEAPGPVTLIFDPLLRLERVFVAAEDQTQTQAEAALARAKKRAEALAPQVVRVQAPVLIVPRVLDPEHCRRLIRFWEENPKIEGAVSSERAGGNVVSRQSKIRTDVVIPENAPETAALVDALGRQLLPEVLKAFSFRVSRVETFRIGCYDSADGGYFAPHRDDTSEQTGYRRYAMSLSLNAGDFEGGFLRMPEFGPQLYAPPAGAAAVFSCSLLHTVMPVTQGRRFAVFGFFYGEEGEKQRQEIQARQAALAEAAPG